MNETFPRLWRVAERLKLGSSLLLKSVDGWLVVRNGGNTADASIVASAIRLTSNPGAGKVLTSNIDGLGSWQDSAGGGAGSGPEIYEQWDVDAPPTSPIADDDEFTSDTSANYSTTGSVTSWQITNGHLEVLPLASNGGWEPWGLHKSTSGYTNLRVDTKISVASADGNYQYAGIMVRETSTSQWHVMMLADHDSQWKGRSMVNVVDNLSAAGTLTNHRPLARSGYLRLCYDNTAGLLIFLMSPDGVGWHRVATHAFTNTPDRVGLFVATSNYNNAEKPVMRFEFLRLADSADELARVAGQFVAQGGPNPAESLQVSNGNVSNPPTSAELDALFGTPAVVGNGFARVLDDNGAGTNVYLVAAQNDAWWYQALTKAL